VLLLAKIDDESLRATYLKDLDVLTRSELEKNLQGKKPVVEANDDSLQRPVSAEDLRIADEIQRALGLKVRLSRSNPQAENGKLTIEFYGDGDLQIVFRKLVAEA
jgi:hypothetical protein